MIFSLRKKAFLFIGLILTSVPTFAKKGIVSPAQVTKTVTGPVEVCGYGRFKNRIFDQRINANGKLELQDVTLKKSLSINGSAFIKKSIFKETVDSNGLMEAQDATFENTITFEGKLFLEDSRAKDIIIANESKKNPSKLILKGETVINGNVAFEGEPGIVERHKNAKITGVLINGKIVRKK